MEKGKIIALFVAAIMATGVFLAVLMVTDTSAADDTYGTPTEITIAPGMRYTYTPTYPSDLTVTTVIYLQKQGSLPGTDVNIAQMNSGITLQVDIPSGIEAGAVYHIVLKATSSDPYQEKYIHIKFNITGNLAVSGSHLDIIAGGSFSMTPVATGMGTKVWSVRAGTQIPSGLSLDPDTGTVTGIVTEPGNFTISLTCTSSYGETADLTVVFRAVSPLELTNSPANGIIIMPS